ncbi:hypothetical protein HCN44_002973 [Aphidius gifuensis]|uniref:Upstream activation factor subunit spp27 n=1 Tax=Aphidius gifuensis TaxID=684658 RepID=A0A834XV86_APHGI|nr:upstream activation factor subunit spp27 [Aphidius gifuensis]KAF7991411.1 hypothetical protein HCN44_002973 [Aphidius gifuensis]
MADISKDELRKEITAILKDADLTTMSAKKVRQNIEEKLDIDLSSRKKEVDDLVMDHLQEKQDDGGKKKKKAASEESEEGEEEEEEEDEASEEEEEEEKKPAKRGPPKKTPSKRKKGSSDDDESGSDDDASDEEYSPKKVAKVTPKKGKPAAKKGKGKGKGSDSDSDEDWGKSKKPAAGAKKGPGKGKGGYTRAIPLSPELAAIVGAEAMARGEVVKKVWAIIRERNLYDPKNKQYAICDDELMKVIGVKRFRTFGMMKYLKSHFVG